MPTRAQAETKLILDLDQLVPEPMEFRLGGQKYLIQVGTVRKLAEMSKRLEKVLSLLARKAQGDPIPDSKLYEAYHEYLSVLCPKLTAGVIESMTFPQLRALLKTIIRYATGQQTDLEADGDAEKKKTIA